MRAIVFDVDGVLLDSRATHGRIWREWSELHALDFETVWAASHGRRIAETLAHVAPHLNADEEQARIREIMLREGDAAFPAQEGAKELLFSLPVGRWAIVTSARGDNVRRRFTIAGLVTPTVLIDDTAVCKGKPAPEGYLLAAEHLGVEASECLVVEDAPAGVEAGLAAGMTVLALATTHDAHHLRRAHEVASSLVAALPRLHGWLETQGPRRRF